MPRHLLYATTNPGKIAEVRTLLAPHGIPVLAPSDLGLDLDVPEPGTTLEANAAGKTRAYLAALKTSLTTEATERTEIEIGKTREGQEQISGKSRRDRTPPLHRMERGSGGEVNSDYIVLGDDTGVGIDALDGEPGIHVRRWNGSRMTDEAIIAYCMDRLRGVPLNQRGAQFRTVFAVGVMGGAIEYFDGTLRGVILEEPDPLQISGFPFESIFFVPEWDLLLGHAHQLSAEDRAGFVTHRARALANALPRIRELLTV